MNDHDIVTFVKQTTLKHNRDNITRTHAYQLFYLQNEEIRWSFLASMVSRNAGWNMCDLEGKHFPKAIKEEKRKQLFLFYEKANWLIFSDAYPQLLLYELSKQEGKPYFYLFPHFFISDFMRREWEYFWDKRDGERLIRALIINEQCLIQEPIIEKTYFVDKVFQSFEYKIQDYFQFSYVLFPTVEGELYGFSVSDFQELKSRIQLGYSLNRLLFSEKGYPLFKKFAHETEHTGSRWDYEKYFPIKGSSDTFPLREVYPLIPHQRTKKVLGVDGVKDAQSYFFLKEKEDESTITVEFLLKQQRLKLFMSLKHMLL